MIGYRKFVLLPFCSVEILPCPSFPGSAWERAARQALPAGPGARQSLAGSAFPGRAWEREDNSFPRSAWERGISGRREGPTIMASWFLNPIFFWVGVGAISAPIIIH